MLRKSCTITNLFSRAYSRSTGTSASTAAPVSRKFHTCKRELLRPMLLDPWTTGTRESDSHLSEDYYNSGSTSRRGSIPIQSLVVFWISRFQTETYEIRAMLDHKSGLRVFRQGGLIPISRSIRAGAAVHPQIDAALRYPTIALSVCLALLLRRVWRPFSAHAFPLSPSAFLDA